MPRLPSGTEKQLLRLVETKMRKVEALIKQATDETYTIGEALTVLNERGLYGAEILQRSLGWCAKTREELFKAQASIGKA